MFVFSHPAIEGRVVMSKRTKVVEYLWRALRPGLTAKGFSRMVGAHGYRDHEATIDVLKIEFFDASTHRVWGTSGHSFAIGCGVFLKFAPNPFGGLIARGGGLLEPDENLCAIRTRLFRTLPQPSNVPKNVWSVAADLSDLGSVAIDVEKVIESAGMRWFARFSAVEEIADLLRHEDEQMDGDAPCFGFGRIGSPVRNLYLGFAAAASGDSQTGREALVASMSKGGFARLSGSSAVDDLVRSKLEDLRAN